MLWRSFSGWGPTLLMAVASRVRRRARPGRSTHRVGLIAHRGASGYAPENTLAAFAKALEIGAESIEFDVQQTKDGELVVIHDIDLRRVAGARRFVGKMSWYDLSQWDVGSWFDPRFKGERVPRLQDLLDLVERKGRLIELQLEIKDGRKPYEGIEKRILDLLRSRPQWEGKVVISSFNHGALRRVRELDPHIRLGYLVGLTRRPKAIKEVEALRCESVHLSRRQVDRYWVEAIRKSGRKTFVYTVNDRAELERMRALGVDAIFTNFPDIDTNENEPRA